MRYCIKCGAEILDGKKFCSKCGTQVNSNKDTGDNKIVITPECDIKKNDSVYPAVNTETFLNPKDGKNLINKENIFKRKKLLIAVVIVVIICCIFRNYILGGYYLVKAKQSTNASVKVESAIKSLKHFKSNKAFAIVDSSINNIVNINELESIQKEFLEIKSSIPEIEYNKILLNLSTKKVKELVKNKEYNKALTTIFSTNNVECKSFEDYEKIMVNVASKVTNLNETYLSKLDLEEKGQVYYDNFDNDTEDEILQVYTSKSNNSYNQTNIELYKYVDNEYKLIDKFIVKDEFSEHLGKVTIGNYIKDSKAIFLNFISGAHGGSSYVYIVKDKKISRVDNFYVFSLYPVNVADIDNDNIIEIPSLSIDPQSINQSNGGNDKILRWYKAKNNSLILAKTEYIKNNNQDSINKSSISEELNKLDYILPDSNKKYLNDEDISGFSKEVLALARNEIYARYGYDFKLEPFKTYFNAKTWYKPNSYKIDYDKVLTDYERKNIDLIIKWENK